MNLNKSQIAAADHYKGPLLVLSGPGCGKTTVILNRIINLINKYHVNPENILAVTFTKNAAQDMKNRYEGRFDNQEGRINIGTFHSVFFGILKEVYGYSRDNILNEKEKYNILREIIIEINANNADNNKIAVNGEIINNILKDISARKTIRNSKPKSVNENIFQVIMYNYEQDVNKLNKLDFDDMLIKTEKLLKSDEKLRQKFHEKYKYILIDEYQDINEVQHNIIKLIAFPDNNVFAVGDDDQSIYGFRGSRPDIMLKFKDEYKDGKIMNLEVNYRCNKEIVKMSVNLINHNKNRFTKKITGAGNHNTHNPVKIMGFNNAAEEAEYITKEYKRLRIKNPHGKIAVLYRNSTNPVHLINKLKENNIMFSMKEKIYNIYENSIIKPLISYIAVASGDYSRENFLKIIHYSYKSIPRCIFEGESVDRNTVLKKAVNMLEEGIIDMNSYIEIQKMFKDIDFISTLNTYGIINYARYGMNYNQYIEKAIIKEKINPEITENISAVWEILLEHGLKYSKSHEFIKYVKEYTGEITNYGDSNETDLILSTIHGAKGLEYDAVFLMDVNEEILPDSKAKDSGSIEEERRLFYVAMTRASDRLYILYTRERYGKYILPSRFIAEISGQVN